MTPTEGVARSWNLVKAAFEPLEAGIIAQSECGGATLDWQRKVELAWDLANASATLLVAVGADHPAGVATWRAKIEDMG